MAIGWGGNKSFIWEQASGGCSQVFFKMVAHFLAYNSTFLLFFCFFPLTMWAAASYMHITIIYKSAYSRNSISLCIATSIRKEAHMKIHTIRANYGLPYSSHYICFLLLQIELLTVLRLHVSCPKLLPSIHTIKISICRGARTNFYA